MNIDNLSIRRQRAIANKYNSWSDLLYNTTPDPKYEKQDRVVPTILRTDEMPLTPKDPHMEQAKKVKWPKNLNYDF